jgi:hypothetical protein
MSQLASKQAKTVTTGFSSLVSKSSLQFNNYQFNHVDDVMSSNLLTSNSNQTSHTTGTDTAKTTTSSSSSSSSGYNKTNILNRNSLEANIDSHGSSLTNSSKQDDEEEDDDEEEHQEDEGDELADNDQTTTKNSNHSMYSEPYKFTPLQNVYQRNQYQQHSLNDTINELSDRHVRENIANGKYGAGQQFSTFKGAESSSKNMYNLNPNQYKNSSSGVIISLEIL